MTERKFKQGNSFVVSDSWVLVGIRRGMNLNKIMWDIERNKVLEKQSAKEQTKVREKYGDWNAAK